MTFNIFLFCSVIPNGKGPVLKTGDESYYRFESYTLRMLILTGDDAQDFIDYMAHPTFTKCADECMKEALGQRVTKRISER